MKKHCEKNKKSNKKCICCNKTVVTITILTLLIVSTALIYAIQNSLNQVDTPPSNGGDVVVDEEEVSKLPVEWKLNKKIITLPDGVKYGFGKGIVGGKEKYAVLLMEDEYDAQKVLVDMKEKIIDDIYITDDGSKLFIEILNESSDQYNQISDIISYNIFTKKKKIVTRGIGTGAINSKNNIVTYKSNSNSLIIKSVGGELNLDGGSLYKIDITSQQKQRIDYGYQSGVADLENALPICMDYNNNVYFYNSSLISDDEIVPTYSIKYLKRSFSANMSELFKEITITRDSEIFGHPEFECPINGDMIDLR